MEGGRGEQPCHPSATNRRRALHTLNQRVPSHDCDDRMTRLLCASLVARYVVGAACMAQIDVPWRSSYMFLQGAYANSFLNRCKPNVAPEKHGIVSIKSMFTYGRARTALEGASGVLVQGEVTPNVFVLHDSIEGTIVRACLWHPNDVFDRFVRLHDLRSWHDDTFPDSVLIADDAELCAD